MNRIASTVGGELAKGLRLPKTSTAMPRLIGGLITANFAFYGLYTFAPGPVKIRAKRFCNLVPESGPPSLFLYHFCHTSLPSLAFNCAVLGTLGASHIHHLGSNHFMKIFGASCAVGALYAGYDMQSNPN